MGKGATTVHSGRRQTMLQEMIEKLMGQRVYVDIRGEGGYGGRSLAGKLTRQNEAWLMLDDDIIIQRSQVVGLRRNTFVPADKSHTRG